MGVRAVAALVDGSDRQHQALSESRVEALAASRCAVLFALSEWQPGRRRIRLDCRRCDG
jgi:hypothetical protein